MNLIDDVWIPVKRKDGETLEIAPWQVTEGFSDNPIVALDYSRPDFNGSMMQFLIGLFQTVITPQTSKEWHNNWKKIPSSEDLKKACEPYKTAFNFDGNGPRFMQDLELTEDSSEPKSIGALLLEEPGDNTLKNNADLFVKRGQKTGFNFSQAAAALFTLQLNAPSGGAGHRTSLRGGGPLTTLLITLESDYQSLWHNIWLNVFPLEKLAEFYKNSAYDLDDRDIELSHIFPWLSPTKTSKSKGSEFLPNQAHWLHQFWAMPRRIKLRFSSVKTGECTLSGLPNQALVTDYVTQNYGANYVKWQHSLSPHENKALWLPIHPNSGGMSYKHFLGWTFGKGNNDDKDAILPSKNISLHRQDRIRNQYKTSMWAFGFDMDKMKARGYQESKFPVFTFEESPTDAEGSFKSIVTNLLSAAEEIVKNTRVAIKNAWGIDKGDFGFIDSEFYAKTESDFYHLLYKIKERIEVSSEDLVSDLYQNWYETINHVSRTIFDHWVFSSDMTLENTERIVSASKKMGQFNHSKKIKGLLHISN